MKKLTEEEKKKRKSTIGKIIAFIVIITISIACSKYNFLDMGHDFFMSIFAIASGQSAEEPVNTLPPVEENVDSEGEETETTEVTTEPSEEAAQDTATETETSTTE